MVQKTKRLVASLLLGTCWWLASTTAAWAHKLDAVDSFGIDAIVVVPEKAKFESAGIMANDIFPGLISEVWAAKDQGADAALNELLRQQKVDIGQILYEKVRAGIEKSRLGPKLSEESTARLKLIVKDYGVGKAPGGFKNLHPFIVSEVRVEDAAGKTLWKKTAYMTGAIYRTVAVRHADAWFKNPELLAVGFSQVAELQVADLLKGL